ncbi:MAG: Unsaturated rhamnogalacturonyl hydrolase YesR [Verrucomicrobiota bacterium]|jgi:hypothetical protein
MNPRTPPVLHRALRVFAFGALFFSEIPTRAMQAAPAVSGSLETILQTSLAGYTSAAAGVGARGTRMASWEPTAPSAPTQNRLVLIAGMDEPVPKAVPQNAAAPSTLAALQFLQWWTTPDAASARALWQVVILPAAYPEGPKTEPPVFPPLKGFFNHPTDVESRSLWRWSAMSAPDLVVDLRISERPARAANALAKTLFPDASDAAAPELVAALGTGTPSGLPPVPALRLEDRPEHVQETLRTLVSKPIPHSALRTALEKRAARDPLAIARALAARYPAAPGMSYIPALAWTGALRVSRLTGDPVFRDKAVAQMQGFLTGEKPAIGATPNLPSLAGHLAFSDWAQAEGRSDAGALALSAAQRLLPSADAPNTVPHGSRWTDDLFMACAVLARAANATGDSQYADAAERILISYAKRLQRPDGIFVHVESSPFAWGRGNGFAAFGLMEALTHLPPNRPERAALLEIFRKQMQGLLAHQSPDGSWRQVIDEPGAYREFTATAMLTTALARGIRLGWIERETFLPAVERGWRAVSVRIAEDASLVDVCTGTGAKKDCDLSYYLQREALFGADDRGGAMALTAALEILELRGP